MKPDVLIVGAGAAGIFAALRAAELGAKVQLVEKTNRIGTKILVSGGGKCNVAHAGPLESVLKAFRPEEGRFIRPACYKFRNDQIIQFFTDRDLDVYTREDGRVFPTHSTAKDVVAILERALQEAGVEIRRESPVTQIVVENGLAVGVRVRHAVARKGKPSDEPTGYRPATAKNLLREVGASELSLVGEEKTLLAKSLVVCPGGSSYPNSGTTGDGYEWARQLGHTVERVHAALAPIYLKPGPWQDLSGVALREVVLKARAAKEVARWKGDMLFTHQGVSGPCALGISRIVDETLLAAPVRLEIDLWPDESPESVAEALVTAARDFPRRQISTYLGTLLPERIVEPVLATTDLTPDTSLGQVSRKQRNRLVETLKGWPIGEVRHVPLEKGEVVAGGISRDEVDPQTLASKRVEGLFFAGEVLDIAGPVGGYNLQSAFATGYVAGESATKFALS